MEFTTERALPPVTARTDYWIALQDQYAAEAKWQAAAPNPDLCLAWLDACKATESAWQRVIEEAA